MMEIVRIPSAYIHQIKFCSPEDCEYILKTLFFLANGEAIEIEKFEMIIESADERSIKKVRLRRLTGDRNGSAT